MLLTLTLSSKVADLSFDIVKAGARALTLVPLVIPASATWNIISPPFAFPVLCPAEIVKVPPAVSVSETAAIDNVESLAPY